MDYCHNIAFALHRCFGWWCGGLHSRKKWSCVNSNVFLGQTRSPSRNSGTKQLFRYWLLVYSRLLVINYVSANNYGYMCLYSKYKTYFYMCYSSCIFFKQQETRFDTVHLSLPIRPVLDTLLQCLCENSSWLNWNRLCYTMSDMADGVSEKRICNGARHAICMTDRVSERMPDRMPVRMWEGMQDRMP